MHFRENTIHFFTAHKNYSQQDTTIKSNPGSDTIVKSNNSILNLQPVKIIDMAAIDSIFRKSEEREQQMVEQKPIVRKPVYRKIDTTELLYKQFGIAGFPISENLKNDKFNENFLLHFGSIKPEEQKIDQVFAYTSESESNLSLEKGIKKIKPQYNIQDVNFDWITFLLIGALLLIGWVRLFNKKYIAALVKSVLSYKESYTLFKEKNSVMERASFVLNTVFVVTISLFVLQFLLYSNIESDTYPNYIIYLLIFTGFIGLYLLRFLSAKFIGYVFLKQKIFSEYLHNLNNSTKVTALFLLPVVVALQYLAIQYIQTIIWIGVSIVGLIYILQQLRAFQILIRNNVSIFYMILYLCAFEIAPFLIVYKLLLS